MPSLHDLQQRFADAVISSDVAPDFIAGSPSFACDRIAIYRRTTFSNYRKALSASYPVVKRLTGESFFHAAVDAFVHARPSHCGDLNVYGDAFGDFLAGYAPTADLVYLPDVARLEWALDEAQRARDVTCVPEAVLAALTAVPPERLPSLRLEVDPSCRLVASAYPILRIWRTNQPDHAGEDRVLLEEGGDALLVRRGAERVSIERLAGGDHGWLSALQRGATLGQSIEAAQRADAAFDLDTALREHIAAGTVIAVIDR
ncbi:MAG TPA: DNA-binding domain-containing protein [Casimicrobiaceae bacterium]|jgi:hypothetical protein